ncbi:MAG: hypothetical protein ACFB5Z_19025 [Elainellaceae cyanobacterium]
MPNHSADRSSPRSADQLYAELATDLHREHELVNLMIRGCIEHRWSMSDEARDISVAMVYNAFETYAIERGLSLAEAEKFCEQYLEQLIQQIQDCL